MGILYTYKKQLGGQVSRATNEFNPVNQPGVVPFNTNLSDIFSSVQSMQGGAEVDGVGNGPFGSEYGDSGAFGNYFTEGTEVFEETFAKSGNFFVAGAAALGNTLGNLFNHKKNKAAREERNIAKLASIDEAYADSQVMQARGTAQMQANKTNAFLQQARNPGQQTQIANNGLAVPAVIRKFRIAKKGSKVTTTKNNTIICSTRDNMCNLVHKSESPFHHPIFRRGGHIVNKYKKNVILEGPSHDDENDTGHRGDKGLPIVKDGGKIFEVESDELILNADVSKQLEKMTYEYLDIKEVGILIDMGTVFKKEISNNTYSYSDKYKELNHD